VRDPGKAPAGGACAKVIGQQAEAGAPDVILQAIGDSPTFGSLPFRCFVVISHAEALLTNTGLSGRDQPRALQAASDR
jgi:hypothetical protein